MTSTVKAAGATEPGEEDVIEDAIDNDDSLEEIQIPVFSVVNMDIGGETALDTATLAVTSINGKVTRASSGCRQIEAGGKGRQSTLQAVVCPPHQSREVKITHTYTHPLM